MKKFCPILISISVLCFSITAKAQVQTSNTTVTNVTCAGGNNGSISYAISGGPGPVSYSWNNGVSGTATGSCTYAVNLDNPGVALSQFQIKVVVTLAAGMNADFSDITFIDAAGNPLSFWLKDFPTATSATFWVRVPSIPAGNSVIYLSFCGTSTTSASNPNTTFEFFDNFDAGSFSSWTTACTNIDVGGESCNSSATTTQFYSAGTSAYFTSYSSCFTAPYDGAGATASRTVPMANDSLVIDYNDIASVELYGFCVGGTSTTCRTWADGNFLGNGQSRSQGGSCAVNTGTWADETSLPFVVTTGSTTLTIGIAGGDCDNAQGWFDDVRVRKYVTFPPIVTLDTTPQLLLDSLTAGTYTITMTDINGVVTTNQFTVTEPAPMIATGDSTNITCFGLVNGSAWVTIAGGTPAFGYNWNTGETTDTISGLATGTYTVTVTDANTCTASATVNIAPEPAQLVASIDSLNVLCFGDNTGSAWAITSGGTTPYVYAWNNSAATDTINNLASGTYNITVQDANGCSATGGVNITQPASAVSATATASPVTCAGFTNGSAWVQAGGGVSPYSYLWSNSQTTDTITALTDGGYSVTVTDANSCTAVAGAVVDPAPPALVLTMDSVNIACYGNNTGKAWATVSGGRLPYAYLWNNSATTDTIRQLPAGNYNIVVTDSFGCTSTSAVNITEPALPIGFAASVTNVACFGENTGSAGVTASGGTNPYTYLWSNGANTNTITNVAASNYTVTITDSNNCTADTSLTVTQPTAITIQQSQNNPACADSSNGLLGVTAAGGTSPLQYLWSSGSTADSATGLAAGTYSVTTTDANGCTATFTGTVATDVFQADIVAEPSATIVAGDQVTLSLTGNNLASAVWNPVVVFTDSFGLAVTATPATTTIYTAYVTSANNCPTTATIKITVQPKPEWFLPTGFSPNGDGVNDVFHVILRGPVKLVSLSVYNRWGELVYQGIDPAEGWDGTYKDTQQPMGTYVYYVVLRDTYNNTTLNEKGNITLVR